MNKPSHDLSPQELAQHFFKLWSAGLIVCSSSGTQIEVFPGGFSNNPTTVNGHGV